MLASDMTHGGAAKKRFKPEQKQNTSALPIQAVKNDAQEEHEPKERTGDPDANTALARWAGPEAPSPPAEPDCDRGPGGPACTTPVTDECVGAQHAYIRHYYICMASTGSVDGPCLHMIASEMWPLLYNTAAWVKGRRYYCSNNSMGRFHRYPANTGLIIEIRQGEHTYYCRGAVPDQVDFDTFALQHQTRHGSRTTAAALYDRIPIVMPSTTEIVVPVNEAQGVYKLASLEVYHGLPEWSWYQLFNLV